MAAIRSADRAPLFRTRSKRSALSNMISKVSSNGPAVLLRIRLANSPSVAMSGPYINNVDREHLIGIVRFAHVVDAEAIDRAAFEISRAVDAGDARDQPAPFRDRKMQRLMPGHRDDGGGDLLCRRRDLEHEAELVAGQVPDRFERPHRAV